MELVWTALCNGLNLVNLALVIAAKIHIEDLELETAPRAFQGVQKLYSQPLIPLMVLILLVEAVILYSSISDFLGSRRREKVIVIEYAPLYNYVLTQIFIFMTKGFAQLLLIFFSVLCVTKLSEAGEIYEFGESHRDTVADVERVQSLLITSVCFLLVSVLGAVCACSIGCYRVGKADSKH